MRVAVIGASRDRSKFANKAVRAYLLKGYGVFPVNPREKKVEGLTCYGSVLEIPENVDMALMYVPPSIGLKIIDEIAKKGIKKVYFNPGTESPEIEAKAKELGLEAVFECAIRAIGIDPVDIS